MLIVQYNNWWFIVQYLMEFSIEHCWIFGNGEHEIKIDRYNIISWWNLIEILMKFHFSLLVQMEFWSKFIFQKIPKVYSFCPSFIHPTMIIHSNTSNLCDKDKFYFFCFSEWPLCFFLLFIDKCILMEYHCHCQKHTYTIEGPSTDENLFIFYKPLCISTKSKSLD